MNLKLVCLFGAWWVTVSTNDCPYQECTCDPVQILCQSSHLNAIPAITKRNNITYQLLFLDANNISSIPTGSLLPNLTEISLLNNPIATIDDDAFNQSASTLEILTFSDARFSRIPNAFIHLKVLKYLSIYDTFIQDWNEEAMKNIGSSVNTLSLGNVGLTSWPSWLQFFTNLTELSITDSSISLLPEDALDMVSNSLQKLSLIGNNLTSIPNSFSNLRVLQELSVQATNVSELSWLPQSSSLSALYLSNNNISDPDHLSSSLGHLASSLKYLDLQENNLQFFPNLSSLTILEELTLNHNQISETGNGSLPVGLSNLHLAFNTLPGIPSYLSYLQNIMYLDLPRNSITNIEGSDFPPSIMIADFGYNLITELTDTSFPRNSSIAILIFNNNPIVSVSNFSFVNMYGLSTLNLQYTKIARLPLALSSLTSLSRFDISGSVDLVCTCLEKTLQTFVLSVVDVVGNCGLTSIEYFFANLSPSCPESGDITHT